MLGEAVISSRTPAVKSGTAHPGKERRKRLDQNSKIMFFSFFFAAAASELLNSSLKQYALAVNQHSPYASSKNQTSDGNFPLTDHPATA